MKFSGLGHSLVFWLLVSGGLHAAALWGAGGWGDPSCGGAGYIEVALAPSPPAGGRAEGSSGAASARVAALRQRPAGGGSAVAVRETAVTAVPAPVVSPPLPPGAAAPSPGEAQSAGSGALATEEPAGAGGGADGAVGAVATGAGSGGEGGGGSAGRSGDGGMGVRTPPRCLEMRQPAYPRDARRRRWEGEVTLRLHVDSDGSVREVRVAESSGYALLDRAAREAAGGWKFQPARLGPVPVEDDAVFVTVDFRLH